MKAIDVLLSINAENLKGINKTIYCINLVYINFLLGENETAITTLDKYQPDFIKLENHSSLGKSIAINNIYYHIANGENAKASKLFLIAKGKYKDECLVDDFNYFDKILS